MGEEGSTSLGTVERCFALLEEVARRDGARVSELAEALDLPKSTVSRYLGTLHDLEYLHRDGNVYRIGLEFLSVAGVSRESEEIYQVGEQHAVELANEANETTQIVVEQGGIGIVIFQSAGTEFGDAVPTRLGTRMPLHSTAAGKAILAHLPGDRLERLLDQRGLPAITEHTITDRGELLDQLDSIRARGIAFDDQEQFEGYRCVAAPVFHDERVLGAISISGPRHRVDDATFEEEFPDLLSDVAGITTIRAEYDEWV